MLKLATFMQAFSTAGLSMSALQMRDGYIACQSEGMAMHLSLLAEVFLRHAREMYELGATNKDFSVFAAVASTQPSPLTELTLEGFPRTSKDDTDACTELQLEIIWNLEVRCSTFRFERSPSGSVFLGGAASRTRVGLRSNSTHGLIG